MIPYDKVYEQVSRMTETDYESMHNITYFCQYAIAVLNDRLKPGVDASDIRLIMAAAALAYCRYIQSEHVEESDIASMKAGDVTIAKSSGSVAEAAENLALSAISDISELLTDTSFTFTAV